jgi:phage I-like protein
LANRTAAEQKRYGLGNRDTAQKTNVSFVQDRELTELNQRLEKLQQTLREHGYLDDGGASMQSSQAKAQVQRIHTVDDLRKMEETLEERVEALTSGPEGRARKSRFTKMMEERGRRFLYG